MLCQPNRKGTISSISLGQFLNKMQWMMENISYRVFSGIVFSAMTIGQTMSLLPDYGKAKASAFKLFKLIREPPIIDAYTEKGKKVIRLLDFGWSVAESEKYVRYSGEPSRCSRCSKCFRCSIEIELHKYHPCSRRFRLDCTTYVGCCKLFHDTNINRFQPTAPQTQIRYR